MEKIREMLVMASKNGNRRAMSVKDAEKVKAGDMELTRWKSEVAKLRKVLNPYVIAKHGKETEDKELTAMRKKIYPVWDKLIKTLGLDENVLIRKADVDSLIGYNERFVRSTEIGTIQAVQSADLFRKQIESLLGCRMRQFECLTAEDGDLIVQYEQAVRAIKRLTVLLEGYTRQDGSKVNGKEDELAEAEHDKRATEKRLAKLANLQGEATGDIADFMEEQKKVMERQIAELDGEIEVLKDEIKEAKQKLAEAKEFEEANRADYEVLIDRIKHM